MARQTTGIYCRGGATGAVTENVGNIAAASNLLLFSLGGYDAAAVDTDFVVEWGNGAGSWQTMTRIATNVTSGQITSLFQLDNPSTGAAFNSFRVTSARAYSDGIACAFVSYDNSELTLRYSNAVGDGTVAATLQDTVSNGVAGDEIWVAGFTYAGTVTVTGQSQTQIAVQNTTACSNYFYGHAYKNYSAGVIAEISGDYPGLAVAVIREASGATLITDTDTLAVLINEDPVSQVFLEDSDNLNILINESVSLPISVLFAQAAETNLSQVLTVQQGGLAVSLNQISEVDLSQGLTAQQDSTVSLDQISEIDLSQALTPQQGSVISLDQISEIDLSQGLTFVGSLALAMAQATETNLSQALTAQQGLTVTVDQVLETNLAQGLTPVVGAVTISLAQVLETNQALSIVLPAVEYGGVYNIVSVFPTGSSVSIVLYDPITGASVALDDSDCVEIGSTGIYIWHSGKLSTQPTAYVEYPWEATDGLTTTTGLLVLEGTNLLALPGDVWGYALDGAVTAEQLMRGFASAMLSRVSGMDANAPIFRDIANTRNRITATTDADGNRLSITLDLT